LINDGSDDFAAANVQASDGNAADLQTKSESIDAMDQVFTDWAGDTFELGDV
jgi:hypothetical protein